MATVTVTTAALEQMDELPSGILARVEKLLKRLRKWPAVSGAKPLRGRLAGRYRLRTGDYRVQFFVQGKEVIVERVGHRDGFYED